MTLAYLPTFHDDELLYSVVARHLRHRQLTTRQGNLELFGNASVKLTHDIPIHIGAFVATLGSDLHLTAEQIVERHTLLPYYTALRGSGAFESFRDRMLAGERIFREVKGSQTAVPWPRRLRFCDACDAEACDRHGYPIWLRRHQLVTSIVCLRHDTVLRESEVDVTIQRINHPIVPSVTRGEGSPVAPSATCHAMDRYRDLTAFGYAMLDGVSLPLGWAPADPRTLAWRKGYTDGTFTRMKDLIDDFEGHYGEVLRLWPRLESWEGRSRHWLRNLLEGSAYTTDPVCRGLLQCFLETRADAGGSRQTRSGSATSKTRPPKPVGMSVATASDLDTGFADAMRTAAEELLTLSPPQRVTRGSLVRTVPGLMSKLRYYDLPLTEAAIADLVEDHAGFVRRRLRDIFARAAARGERTELASVWGWNITKDRVLIREEWDRCYGERTSS